MKRGAVALTITLMFVSCLAVNTRVRGDGNGYFSWLASSVVDRDLDFRNQYRHANALFLAPFVDAKGDPLPEHVTRTGHIEDQWAVGPAVLWAPWFLAAHAVITATGQDSQDGYAPLYRRACATGSMVYVLLALWFSVQVSKRLGASTLASWSAAAIVMVASSLLVYAFLLPFHVHAVAAFTVALFLWYGVKHGTSMTRVRWSVWGAMAGLMFMTYQVDAIFAFLAVPVAVRLWRAGRTTGVVIDVLLFGVAALVGSAPQWIGKMIVYGSPFTTGYRDQFFWTSPRLLATAFSSNHGLLLWTPIVAIGIAGCLWLARRSWEMRAIVAASAAFYFVIACYQNWHGLSSFGNRFFVSWTLPLVVGVSVIIDGARKQGIVVRIATTALLASLALWNTGLAFQWASKMLPNRGGVDFRSVVRQQVAVPRRAVTLGYRYITDREGLAQEIEQQDRWEAEAHKNIR